MTSTAQVYTDSSPVRVPDAADPRRDPRVLLPFEDEYSDIFSFVLDEKDLDGKATLDGILKAWPSLMGEYVDIPGLTDSVFATSDGTPTLPEIPFEALAPPSPPSDAGSESSYSEASSASAGPSTVSASRKRTQRKAPKAGGLHCPKRPGRNAQMAKLNRERKKKYVSDLETRVSLLSNEVKALQTSQIDLMRQRDEAQAQVKQLLESLRDLNGKATKSAPPLRGTHDASTTRSNKRSLESAGILTSASPPARRPRTTAA